MRLEGITVCINYADYLAIVIANREQFDVWHIITCANDDRTQALCKQYALSCLIVDEYGSDGAQFNPATNKSIGINYGIGHVETDAWVLLLDGDILLPHNFRGIVEHYPKSTLKLYGARRRVLHKITPNFAISKYRTWHSDLEPQAFLGYFQMFSSVGPRNRYLPSDRDVETPYHDDIKFRNAFPVGQREVLPITVVHIGMPVLNWKGRISALEHMAASKNGVLLSEVGAAIELCDLVVTAGASELMALSREVVARRPRLDVSPTAFSYPPMSRHEQMQLLQQTLPKRPVSVYFACDPIQENLWHTVALLKEGGWEVAEVRGTGFGLRCELEVTTAIEIVFGMPDHVSQNGIWTKRLRGLPQGHGRRAGCKKIYIYVSSINDVYSIIVEVTYLRERGLAVTLWGEGTNALVTHLLAKRGGLEIEETTYDEFVDVTQRWKHPAIGNEAERTTYAMGPEAVYYLPRLAELLEAAAPVRVVTKTGEICVMLGSLPEGNEPAIMLVEEDRGRPGARELGRIAQQLGTPLMAPSNAVIVLEGGDRQVMQFVRAHNMGRARLVIPRSKRRLRYIIKALCDEVELLDDMGSGDVVYELDAGLVFSHATDLSMVMGNSGNGVKLRINETVYGCVYTRKRCDDITGENKKAEYVEQKIVWEEYDLEDLACAYNPGIWRKHGARR